VVSENIFSIRIGKKGLHRSLIESTRQLTNPSSPQNNNNNNTCITALCPELPGRAGTRRQNQSGFTGARNNEWQWHQLGHMQICTSSHTDNHASTPSLSFLQADALPAAQPTASKHLRQLHLKN